MIKTKKHVKRIVVALLTVFLFVGFVCVTTSSHIIASADNMSNNTAESDTERNDNPQSRLFTVLTTFLSADNNKVYANVKNDFTLFFATVEVYVYLYSSNTYTASVKDMTLEASNYTSDLNIYETVSAARALNGMEKYWKARSRYKIDNGAWEERLTETFWVDRHGNIF